MPRINKIGRVLLGTVMVALMLPLGGCVIRTRDYYYPRDGYYRDYRDYDGPRYRSYSFYYYYRR
jgi:hypothetical protein